MAVNTKAIKTRIGSVKNTKKITRAMQMIAAVKMRKAVDAAVNTRIYANLANELLKNIGETGVDHPLTETRDDGKTLLVVVTSNRGLCGGYNSSVLKEADKFLKLTGLKPDVIALGKRAATFARNKDLNLLAVYEKLSENFGFDDVIPITKSIMNDFLDKKYKDVYVVYTNYISGLLQKVEVVNLLPITGDSITEMLEKMEDGTEVDAQVEEEVKAARFVDEDEYDFEPNKAELLNFLLPMLVEVQFYHSVLESAASEHSSRMIAMKNATESANDMIDSLTLEYNKSRQAAITQEIAEIVGGANALQG